MYISVSLASDTDNRAFSSGEVILPETMNYRTSKPVPGGLFCQKIFGPIDDYVCSCGRLRGVVNHGQACSVCEVTVLSRKSRMSRYGHIELPVPYINPIIFATAREIFGIPQKGFQALMFGKASVVIAESVHGKIYSRDGKTYGLEIVDLEEGKTGPFYLKKLLDSVDADPELTMSKTVSKKGKKYFEKGYNLFDFFNYTLPICPPYYRPILQMESGYSSHPRNELYLQVMRKALRAHEILNTFEEKDTFLVYESLMIQKNVTQLFYGGAIDRNSQRLDGIIEGLSGKGGLFRGTLLGKRVDFSARSVIASGPHLEIDQIGLPLKMAYELFKPHILGELRKRYTMTLKAALKVYGEMPSECLDILDLVMKKNRVAMNRAPSLHRYSVQAFRPVLSTGKQIQVPPMICSGFNADFDGDTVAIHVIVSLKAKHEAEELLSPKNNILHSLDGSPLIAPSHEVIIGLHHLSRCDGDKPVCLERDIRELRRRLDLGYLKVYDKVLFIKKDGTRVETSLGRLMLEEVFSVPVNEVLNKKSIKNAISRMFDRFGRAEVLIRLKKIQDLGFEWATLSGISVGIDDFIPPKSKVELFAQGNEYEREMKDRQKSGELDEKVAYENIARNWNSLIHKLEKEYLEDSDPLNPLLLMYTTGSRVSLSQLRQLIVTKGMFTNIAGKVLAHPIEESLYEGVSGMGYFNSCSGSRKSLGDKKFMTPKAGFLTRQLISAARDLFVSEKDCGTRKGIRIARRLAQGRYAPTGEMYSPSKSDDIVVIRSPITCESTSGGVCAVCCGTNPALRALHRIGDSVGCIASHAISEPSTQMSMRTFHTGGAATIKDTDKLLIAAESGIFSSEKDEVGLITKITVGNVSYFVETRNFIFNTIKEGDEVEKGYIIGAYVDADMSNSDISGSLPKMIYALGGMSPGETCTVQPSALAKCDGVIRVLPGYDEYGRPRISVYLAPEGTENAFKKPVAVVQANLILVGDGQRVEAGQKLTYGIARGHEFYSAVKNVALAGEVFVNQTVSLMENDGIYPWPVHFETIFRAITNTVIMEDGDTGLRTHGAVGEISPRGIGMAACSIPSWLKSLGYGWVKNRLEVAVCNNETTLSLNTEKIMSGELINTPLKKYPKGF